MKFLFLFLFTACASRFENFSHIKAGMSKIDLRGEMSMVEGILTFPPYEFRSYELGLVVLKDDVVLETFPVKPHDDLTVVVRSSVGVAHTDHRYAIRAPHARPGEETLFALAPKQLGFLMRMRGYTMPETPKDVRAEILMQIDRRPKDEGFDYRLSLGAVTQEKGSLWRVEVTAQSTEDYAYMIPMLLAVASDYMQIPLRDPKTDEVRYTSVAARMMQEITGVERILSHDITLKKTTRP